MSLFTLEKTWEHRTNIIDGPLNADSELAAAELAIICKNILLDQTHHGFNGTINEITPGVTYELVATSRAGHPILNSSGSFLTDFLGGLVGRKIEIRGATSGGNNGIFTITSVVNATTIRYTNAGGVAEAFVGNYRVSTGYFTARGGGFGPWICKGSGAGSTGKGSGMDERDRWHTTADMQSSTSTVGNRSHFTFRNAVSGAEWVLECRTSSTSDDFERMTVTVSPENGFSGGTATAVPTAADGFVVLLTSVWSGRLVFGSTVWSNNIMHSTDGMETRWFGGRDNVWAFLWMVGRAANFKSGPVIPWTGGRNIIGFGVVFDADATGYSTWNDAAAVHATLNHLGTPTHVAFNLTGRMWVSSMAGQINFLPGEFDLSFAHNRIGLASNSVPRTRNGRLVDVFWGPSGSRFETYYPEDGTKQFLQLEGLILPWDGTFLRRL